MDFVTFWNKIIAHLPNPHFLQTWQWGQVKARYGWQPYYLLWDAEQCTVIRHTPQASAVQPENAQEIRAAAMVLKKTVISGGMAARLSLLYCPKGPNLDWSDTPLRKRVLDDLERFGRQQSAIFLKCDPDVVLGKGIPGTESEVPEPAGETVRADWLHRGWHFSEEQIQFRNTVLLDVSLSEEEMLARMKQKTRYNLRLAARKGVSVRPGTPADWPLLYRMYAETAARDGFVIREEAYYRTVWTLFSSNHPAPSNEMPVAEALIAEVEGEPIAAVFLFAFAGRAYYVYGMSREAHREKMPNYLLQWEAIQWAQRHGCRIYDLWGAPDVFNENDPMWGVFRFKEGLGGEVIRTLGAWDYVPHPVWYAIYTRIMPKVLDWMRARGKARWKHASRESA
ncbi:MAG: peptidoglycan bridge formation glycyltransferase FemA/FemB family protein [Anaerolineales bacterium]|nr:peptidoglycan bridge formation glycyltransferase FemA/FemB family protein [Anaerolineales bacterium]MDW8278125.1 peptidoglycan bridge formation glycyltransferase FemA/FemB family protein [Anaerolineales bacterium]